MSELPPLEKPIVYIGTAAWAIPPITRDRFGAPVAMGPRPKGPSILELYSRQFNAVEINSSFYKDHQPKTYRRWAESVPPHFRFSVKLSRLFTHELKLQIKDDALARVLEGVLQLQEKLGVLLVQLPPSLRYEPQSAASFFKELRSRYAGRLFLEPRHLSWADLGAAALMQEFSIFQVKADPPAYSQAAILDARKNYYRLHGSPEIYKSNYDDDYLKNLFVNITGGRRALDKPTGEETGHDQDQETWVIFDNTYFGYATLNALSLRDLFSATFGARSAVV